MADLRQLKKLHDTYKKHAHGITFKASFIKANDTTVRLCTCGNMLETYYKEEDWDEGFEPANADHRGTYIHSVYAAALKRGYGTEFLEGLRRLRVISSYFNRDGTLVIAREDLDEDACDPAYVYTKGHPAYEHIKHLIRKEDAKWIKKNCPAKTGLS